MHIGYVQEMEKTTRTENSVASKISQSVTDFFS